MDIVIALDFDGTLYPITDYDSEQMLLHLSGRDGAEELIERDKKGGYDPIIFNDDFEKIISGLDESYIMEATRIIHERIGKDDLAPLRRLQEKGCHIAVISCGSNRLIEEFLRMENLEAELIVAKELIIENGKIRGMIRHINSIEDKAKAIEAIRTTWPGCTIIAVGDGPTDAHMLSLADYPFVISWNGKRRLEGYEIIDSFGTVSPECAAAMAEGVRRLTGADYAVSTTGNAGPSASEGKPVGLVWVGISSCDRTETVSFNFRNDRIRNIERFSSSALNALRKFIASSENV